MRLTVLPFSPAAWAPLLGATLLAATTALHAQAPADGAKGRRHLDCSQAKDPKACEERVAKFRAAHEKAKAACEGKQGEAQHECMRLQMCSQAKDPKACQERSAKARDAVEKARQTCESKKGNEHRDCMRHEICAQSKDPAGCEAKAKARMEKREKRQAAPPAPAK